MDANTPVNPVDQRKQDRARKRKALLAGGVVLGLGAAVTLAAWSDDVFANGTFNTGSFDLIGSAATDATPGEGAYADWDSTDGADLTFKIDSTNMYPGETVVAPFSIAQATGTSVDGRVWMYQATASGPLAEFLSYDIKKVTAPTGCMAADPEVEDGDVTPGASVPAWNEGDFAPAGDPVENFAGKQGISPVDTTQDLLVRQNFGNQQHLCIQVTLADDEDDIAAALAVSAADSSIVWQFKGESEIPTS